MWCVNYSIVDVQVVEPTESRMIVLHESKFGLENSTIFSLKKGELQIIRSMQYVLSRFYQYKVQVKK